MTHPTLRFDLVTERWVSVAPARAFTSSTLAGALPTLSGPCPFCPGHESDTEAAVLTLPSDGAWQARVVRNRYPVVTAGEATAPVTELAEMPAEGVHEVVIESRDHDSDLDTYTLGQCTLAMQAYRDRIRALDALPWARTVSMFRNRGKRAGGSQPHPHGQIIALAVPADELERRVAIAQRHADRTGGSLIDDRLAAELEAGERVIEATAHFVAFCPFASHRRYEIWIVPRAGIASLGALDDARLGPLAEILGRTMRRLARVTSHADYNLVLRSAPPRTPAGPAARAWIEILPRTGGPAGYELTTGIDIVTVTPEAAAAAFRAASADP